MVLGCLKCELPLQDEDKDNKAARTCFFELDSWLASLASCPTGWSCRLAGLQAAWLVGCQTGWLPG